MKILVFAEQRDSRLKSSAAEALTAAAQLQPDASQVAAVIIGKSVEPLAAELAGYGADKVYVAEAEVLENYNVITYAAALEAAIKAFSPDLVIGGATPMGKDLFPRLAARCDSAILTDLTELSLDGSKLVATKPMYAGKVLAKVSMPTGNAAFASIRPNVFAASKSGQGAAQVEKLSVSVTADDRLVTKEIRKGGQTKADLTEAKIIVSGGRAMGSADNFKILHELAEVLGATVGASRAAVDSGYATHDMQVGQTGKTVNPNLYIACGISGAVQHLAGMRTSKVIVAINNDPEAPIFSIADYGIVGDLFKVVPVMTKKFKELLG